MHNRYSLQSRRSLNMEIHLPDREGRLAPYRLKGLGSLSHRSTGPFNRRVFAAAHVVADPFAQDEPSHISRIDWNATIAYRRHLSELGLGIAEAMDTAQRGSGLDWPSALELIRQTRQELPDALVFSGCGTDQLEPSDTRSIDDVSRAYDTQIAAIQKLGGRIILMASRALAKVARSPDDYARVYRGTLANCDAPVILHWLGDMFDPALKGYWGADRVDEALEMCLAIIGENAARIEGIKISLLDKDIEIRMRRRLPAGVQMLTGDDFNYPELIEGDERGHSGALLGVFDPLASIAAEALSRLASGDGKGFRAALDPTVPLARLLFSEPTRHYKTGVVFLAWLNGFQDHFVMLGGAQSMRPLPYFVNAFRLADGCGLFRDPERAVHRMRALLSIYGI